jgi:hypothetical protein
MRKIAVLATLLFVTLTLAGCPANDEEYQRPRSGDQPQIYSDLPPVGTNSHGGY